MSKYKARKVEGGWQVFRVEPGTEPVLIPRVKQGRVTPYPHKQAAYRKAKQLNDADSNKEQDHGRTGSEHVEIMES